MPTCAEEPKSSKLVAQNSLKLMDWKPSEWANPITAAHNGAKLILC